MCQTAFTTVRCRHLLQKLGLFLLKKTKFQWMERWMSTHLLEPVNSFCSNRNRTWHTFSLVVWNKHYFCLNENWLKLILTNSLAICSHLVQITDFIYKYIALRKALKLFFAINSNYRAFRKWLVYLEHKVGLWVLGVVEGWQKSPYYLYSVSILRHIYNVGSCAYSDVFHLL